MKVILSRYYNQYETLGGLFILDGDKRIFECKTIELPWRQNGRNVSCIPEGTYNVIRYESPTKGDCFHVLDVPNRDSILIHKGNYAYGPKVDTRGCILPGKSFSDVNGDGQYDVIKSTETMGKLLEILPRTFKLIVL
jgi:hypothetical protein